MEKEFVVRGKIEQEYSWSAGIAGSRFLQELKENGRIVGTKCSFCKRTVLPPRIFCEKCFNKMEEWEVLSDEGTVYTFCISNVGIQAEKLEKPVIVAIINIDGAEGGIYHYLGEVDEKDVKIGMRVKAVFKNKEEREGSILDIKYFKPI